MVNRLSENWNWFQSESGEDRVLRLLIIKAGELDRLPTSAELQSDPRMPSLYECAFYCDSITKALQRVAGLLYGSPQRQSPEDLLSSQQNLSESEQAEAKRRQRAEYQQRLAELSQKGSLQAYRHRSYLRQIGVRDDDKVTELPMQRRARVPAFQSLSWRQERQEDRERRERRVQQVRQEQERRVQQDRQKQQSQQERLAPRPKPQSTSPPRGSLAASFAQIRLGAGGSISITEPANRPEANTPSSTTEPTISKAKGVRKMGKEPQYTKEDAVRALRAATEYYGGLTTAMQFNLYSQQERTISYSTLVKLIGPKSGWTKALDASTNASAGTPVNPGTTAVQGLSEGSSADMSVGSGTAPASSVSMANSGNGNQAVTSSSADESSSAVSSPVDAGTTAPEADTSASPVGATPDSDTVATADALTEAQESVSQPEVKPEMSPVQEISLKLLTGNLDIVAELNGQQIVLHLQIGTTAETAVDSAVAEQTPDSATAEPVTKSETTEPAG